MPHAQAGEWRKATLRNPFTWPEGRRFEDWEIVAAGPSFTWDTRDGAPPPPRPSILLDEGPEDARVAISVRVLRVQRVGSPVYLEQRGRGEDTETLLRNLHLKPTWPQVDEALSVGMAILDRALERVWDRTTSDQEFIAARGRLLAVYCRARGITNPMDLDRRAVSEATGYASEESMRNALNQKGVRTEHIKAEAYRLIFPPPS